jgi:hypothetical protein
VSSVRFIWADGMGPGMGGGVTARPSTAPLLTFVGTARTAKRVRVFENLWVYNNVGSVVRFGVYLSNLLVFRRFPVRSVSASCIETIESS